jgi:hypothetical protein
MPRVTEKVASNLLDQESPPTFGAHQTSRELAT